MIFSPNNLISICSDSFVPDFHQSAQIQNTDFQWLAKNKKIILKWFVRTKFTTKKSEHLESKLLWSKEQKSVTQCAQANLKPNMTNIHN